MPHPAVVQMIPVPHFLVKLLRQIYAFPSLPSPPPHVGTPLALSLFSKSLSFQCFGPSILRHFPSLLVVASPCSSAASLDRFPLALAHVTGFALLSMPSFFGNDYAGLRQFFCRILLPFPVLVGPLFLSVEELRLANRRRHPPG